MVVTSEKYEPNDEKLSDFLIHNIDMDKLIDVVKKHHNEPDLIKKLETIAGQYKDLVISPSETAKLIQTEAPQFHIFHVLRQELASSEDVLYNIVEELYSDKAMTTSIEAFEDKTGISLIGAIQENQELENRYKIRLATFRKQLYTYLVGEHRSELATMNYLVSTKKTLAQLLVADNQNRTENGQNSSSSI